MKTILTALLIVVSSTRLYAQSAESLLKALVVKNQADPQVDAEIKDASDQLQKAFPTSNEAGVGKAVYFVYLVEAPKVIDPSDLNAIFASGMNRGHR